MLFVRYYFLRIPSKFLKVTNFFWINTNYQVEVGRPPIFWMVLRITQVSLGAESWCQNCSHVKNKLDLGLQSTVRWWPFWPHRAMKTQCNVWNESNQTADWTMNEGPCLVPSDFFFDVGQVFSLDRRAFSARSYSRYGPESSFFLCNPRVYKLVFIPIQDSF